MEPILPIEGQQALHISAGLRSAHERGAPHLRATQDGDHDFLLELHRTTQPKVAHMPMNLAQSLADMQLQAQNAGYRQRFPRVAFQIICDAAGVAAGCLATARTPTDLHLLDIALLPAYRGRGWGTSLIASLQHQATALNVPLQLTVARTNRAQHLYLRLGFTVTKETEPDLGMTWRDQQQRRGGDAVLWTRFAIGVYTMDRSSI